MFCSYSVFLFVGCNSMYFHIRSSAVSAMADVLWQVIKYRTELTITTDVSAKVKMFWMDKMQYLKMSSRNVPWRQLYETRFRANVEWPSDVLLKLKNTQKSSFIVLMMPVVKIKQRNRVSCGSYLWTHSTLQKCGHLHHIIWNQNYSRFPCSNNPVQVQLKVVL